MIDSNPMKNRTELGLERLIFFSDAVIAIAITLLVLDLRLPEVAAQPLAAQLESLGSSFLSFFMSFAVIGLFWEAHRRLFGYIERYDRTLLWLNLLFLLFIVFLPFPTSVLGKHWSATAIVFYADTLAATGIARAFLWSYAVSRHLVGSDLDPAVIRAEVWRGWAVPGVFLLSLILATFNPTLAALSWVLLAPVSIVGRRLLAKVS
jgi:uncharacterized membrane protein